MQILGLIPARGGSKGIPGKNIISVAGKPLLAYTCEAALRSARLTRIVLTTDDPQIAQVGRECGVEAPFMRPAALAEDDTPMLAVMNHALQALETGEEYRPDLVVLLQPTSPLRRAEHIDAAIDLLVATGADTVVSVVEVPHRFSPVSLLVLEDGRLVPWLGGPMVPRRQDKPRLYARNGPAVLVTRREVVLAENSLYGRDCRPLFMDEVSSLDIDAGWDLEVAALLLLRAT